MESNIGDYVSHYVGKICSQTKMNLRYFNRGLKVLNGKLDGVIRILEKD